MKVLSDNEAVCPICGANQQLLHSLDKANGYNRYHCQQCDVIFSDPMQNPGVEWYQASDVYRERRERSTPIPLSVIRKDWRFKTFMDLGYARSKSILDLGCGTGIFMKIAQDDGGYTIEGVESDPIAVETAEELYGVDTIRIDTAESFVSSNDQRQYDIITMFDVLEHLDNPLQIIRDLKTRLSPQGLVIITVPGHRRQPTWFAPETDLPPHHLTLWSSASLRRCFQEAEYDVVDIIRSPLWSGDLVNQLFHKYSAFKRLDMVGRILRGGSLFILMPIMAQLLSLRHDAGGFTIMGIAQKTVS